MSYPYNTLPHRSIPHPIAIAQVVISNPPTESTTRYDRFAIELPILDSPVPLIHNLRAIVDRYRQQIRLLAQLKK